MSTQRRWERKQKVLERKKKVPAPENPMVAAVNLLKTVAHGKNTTHHEAIPCPTCGQGLDASDGLNGTSPHDGSLSICIYCGEISLFKQECPGAKLTLVHMSKEEIDAIPERKRLRLLYAQKMVKEVAASVKRKREAKEKASKEGS